MATASASSVMKDHKGKGSDDLAMDSEELNVHKRGVG